MKIVIINIRKEIGLQKHCIEGIFECCGIEINYSNTPIIVLCLYRPSNDSNTVLEDFFKILTNVIQELRLKYLKHNFFITGDFNINLLVNSKIQRQFENVLQCYNLHAMFNVPTRITSHSATCIDNIVTDIDPTECEAKILHNGFSDHTAQLLIVRSITDTVINDKQWIRSFSETNLNKFLNFLRNETWAPVYKS